MLGHSCWLRSGKVREYCHQTPLFVPNDDRNYNSPHISQTRKVESENRFLETIVVSHEVMVGLVCWIWVALFKCSPQFGNLRVLLGLYEKQSGFVVFFSRNVMTPPMTELLCKEVFYLQSIFH